MSGLVGNSRTHFVTSCTMMVVPVFVDLRFKIQMKNRRNIDNKILCVDDEEKLYNI